MYWWNFHNLILCLSGCLVLVTLILLKLCHTVYYKLFLPFIIFLGIPTLGPCFIYLFFFWKHWLKFYTIRCLQHKTATVKSRKRGKKSFYFVLTRCSQCSSYQNTQNTPKYLSKSPSSSFPQLFMSNFHSSLDSTQHLSAQFNSVHFCVLKLICLPKIYRFVLRTK